MGPTGWVPYQVPYDKWTSKSYMYRLDLSSHGQGKGVQPDTGSAASTVLVVCGLL